MGSEIIRRDTDRRTDIFASFNFFMLFKFGQIEQQEQALNIT
jgi:hypothetical protein